MASASPPTEKATARQDQAGKASTDDGARNGAKGDCRIVVGLKAAASVADDSAAQYKLSDGFARTGLHVEVSRVSNKTSNTSAKERMK